MTVPSLTYIGKEEIGLPAGDCQCQDPSATEAHGELDCKRCEILHHSCSGGCCSYAMLCWS